MQKSLYSGTSSLFTLDVTLDGEATEGSQAGDTLLEANVAVVLASDVDYVFDFSTFIFEAVPGSGGVVLTQTEISYGALGLIGTGPESVTNSISFTLNNGDNVFIFAELRARALRGGTADAFNTLGLAFSAGNVGALTAVPLPAPILLLASCAGVLMLQRRRST